MKLFTFIYILLCPFFGITQIAKKDSLKISLLDSLRSEAMDIREYSDAIKIATEQVELAEDLYDSNSKEYFANKLKYAFTIKSSGDYDKAEQLYLNIFNELERNALDTTKVYCDVLNNLSFLYMNMSDYQKSEIWFDKAFSAVNKVEGEYSSDNYVLLNNYGLLQYNKGDYDKAIEFYGKSLCIIEDLEGKESSAYAHKLNNIAGAYFRKGDLYRCQNTVLESKRITEMTDGVISKRYLTIIENLSFLYRATEKYDKAFDYFRQSYDLNKKLYGKNADKSLEFLKDEANLLFAMNDYASAKELIDEFFLKSSLKESTAKSDNLFSYYDKAKIYMALGLYDEGLESILMAHQIAENNHEENFDQLGVIKGLLAKYYLSQGKINKALKLRIEAEEILINSTGEKHRDYISNLNQIGSLFLKLGQLDSSRVYIEKARTLKLRYFDRNSLTLLADDLVEASLAFAEENYEESQVLFKKSLEIRYDYLKRNMPILSFERRINLYQDFNSAYNQFLSRFLVDLEPDQEMLNYIYQWSRSVRELATNITYLSKKNTQSFSSYQTDLYEEIQSLNTRINRAISYDGEKLKDKKINLDSMISHSLRMEEELLSSQKIRFNKLEQKILPLTALSLVFLEFEYKALNKSTPHKKNYAILKDESMISSYSLENLSSLPAFNGQSSEEDYRLAFELLFAPYADKFKNYNSIWIEPQGRLFNIPFNALLFDDKFVKEDFKIFINGRNSFSGGSNSSDNLLLVGNDFISENDGIDSIDSEEFIAMRGFDLRSQLKPFKALNHVSREISVAKENLPNKKLTILKNENEAMLKDKLYNNSYKLIHIASHGFFVNTSSQVNQVKKGLNNSGVALSDANDFLSFKNKEGDEDGLLTALEIMELPLQNSDLVILSTCQSAKGMVHHKEGNIGLHLAFKALGAKNLILTLWNVSDSATEELMSSFYEYISAGNSIKYSFDQSLDVIKAKYPKNIWSAYVLYGAGDEILFPSKVISQKNLLIGFILIGLIGLFFFKSKAGRKVA